MTSPTTWRLVHGIAGRIEVLQPGASKGDRGTFSAIYMGERVDWFADPMLPVSEHFFPPAVVDAVKARFRDVFAVPLGDRQRFCSHDIEHTVTA